MKSFDRSNRVGKEIIKCLSDLLRKKVKDPRLEMVTITSVRMSSDLRTAYIYYSTSPGKESVEAAARGFQSAFGYFKRTLASRLGLRYMPELKFNYDNSFDYGTHIDDVLKSLDDKDESNTTGFEE